MRIHSISICLLLLAPLLAAQSFDPAEFFGRDAYTGDHDQGALSLSLKGPERPHFIDFKSSGGGRVADRFEFTGTGLVVNPDKKHRSCEAALDIGLAAATASLKIIELDRGGTVAWHLRALESAKGRKRRSEYLAEVRHQNDGSVVLRIRVRTRARFVEIQNARVELKALKLPAKLTIEFTQRSLKLSLSGKNEITAKVSLSGGAGIAFAVSDARARLRSLLVKGRLAEPWRRDAAVRLAARKALAQLKQYATHGLLQGVADFPHPRTEQELGSYSNVQLKARAESFARPFVARFRILADLARALPDSPLAHHEAGVAALLAGESAKALTLLRTSTELHATPVTGLSYAEACRRLGDFDGALKALAGAEKGLPDELRPEHILLKGRLLAAQGRIAEARTLLTEGSRKYSDHAQLSAFAESAQEMLEPAGLTRSRLPGPFHLTLISDLPVETLRTIMDRVKPYLEKIRLWLPDLADELTGTIAVYAGPTDYLRAALLVAGENLDNVAGMYLPSGIGGSASVIACRAFGEDELVRTLVHELWHLAFATCGSEHKPAWLNEGMAVYLSAGVIDGGVMAYDRLPSEFAEIQGRLASFLTPETAASASGAEQIEFYRPGQVRTNYAVSWALVWYHAASERGARLLRKRIAGETVDPFDFKELLPKVRDRLKKGIKS